MTTHGDSPDVPVRVRSMSVVADDVLSVELVPLDGSPAPWEPGAHIDLVIPGVPVRQYSLCGVPGSGSLRIAVLREEESRGGSSYVHRTLRPGDTVAIRGPRNHFALEDAPEYLFIAGGIGITPLLPMIARASEAGARWSLVYLGSATSRMPFLDELGHFGEGVQIVTRDTGARAELSSVLAAHPDALVYACGPERMLAELRERLGDDGRLRFEYFSAPDLPEAEPTGGFTVRLERTGVDVEVPDGVSVLEVMRGAGVDVLSDCEEGICGSCETGVISGEVDHRDLVLTKQERAANDCMMVCVSRAACPLLVLDA